MRQQSAPQSTAIVNLNDTSVNGTITIKELDCPVHIRIEYNDSQLGNLDRPTDTSS